MAGTSYTRQSTITDGNLITASLFNNEYNQLLNAFVYSSTGTTGHTHDGTAGQGGAIGKIGDQDFKNKIEISATNNRIECYIEVGGSPVEQLRIQDGAIVPVTDSDIDLGTTSLRFKDAFVDSLTVTGVVTATGFTIGSAVITEAELEILDGKTFLDEDDLVSDSATGIPSQQSVKAYIDAQVTAQDLDLTDGTTSISIDLDSEALSVLGGTGITSTASGNGVTLAIDSTVATLTGSQTLTNKTLTAPDINTPDIDGGTIDGTIIGGTTAAAGSFTTVDATGNITVGGTVDGRDVAADGTKLDGIETAATADQTDAEIRAAVEAATDSNVFTDADHSKLNAIEASADVTDTTNVTAAGALMDSELTSIASVKALNQGVATTDSPTFVGLTTSGEITANGGIALGDSDQATFGAGDDLAIYHNGADSWIANSTGNLNMQVTENAFFQILDPASNKLFRANDDGDVELYHNGAQKLATTSTGIDVTGKITVDSLGSIGVVATDRLYMATSDGLGIQLDKDNNRIVPVGADGSTYNNNVSLGSSGLEFKNLFLSGTATMGGLTVQQPSGANILLESTTTGATTGDIFGEIEFKTNDSSSAGVKGKIDSYSEGGVGNGALRLFTGNTTGLYERMRITSAGHTTFGTTNLTPADSAVNGTSILSDGRINHNAQSQPAAVIGRTGTDGAIADFRKNGTTVGTIGVNTSGLYIADAGVGFRFDSGGTDDIIPCNATGGAADASINLGSSGARFQDLYLSGEVIAGAGANNNPSITSHVDTDTGLFFGGGNILGFSTGGGERMRIDASGNLLVGKTSTSGGIAGTVLAASGLTRLTASGIAVAEINRLSSDGSIVDFKKNGTTVGSIGTVVGRLSIGSGDTGVIFAGDIDAIYPANGLSARDNAIDIGSSGARFKDLYLSGSVGIGSSGSVRFNGIGDTTHAVGYDSTIDGSFMRGQLGMRFLTGTGGGSERMRIDSAGNLTVGDSSTAGPSNSACTIAAGGAITTSRAATNNQTHHSFVNPNGVVGTIKTIASQTSFNTSSDQRLKENIADADDAGSKVDAIQVRQYDWKADGSHQDYGMIAQELLEVAPEAVSQGETEEDMMGVDYSKLVPMLVKEIQSLRNRVAQLEE